MKLSELAAVIDKLMDSNQHDPNVHFKTRRSNYNEIGDITLSIKEQGKHQDKVLLADKPHTINISLLWEHKSK